MIEPNKNRITVGNKIAIINFTTTTTPWRDLEISKPIKQKGRKQKNDRN